MQDIRSARPEQVVLKIGAVARGGTLAYLSSRIYFLFPYWPNLNTEIKTMAGHKCHGFDENNPQKIWSAADNSRNRFALAYLKKENPYAVYDKALEPIENPIFPLFTHQKDEFTPHMLSRPGSIVAGEMGTGKTLAVFEVLGQLANVRATLQGEVWYVAPKSVLRAINFELYKWQKIHALPGLKFISYEQLVQIIKSWPPGKKAPQVLILDESSRVKTPSAQRSQAAFQCAEGVRQDWGNTGRVILMSGTPAPRSPLDWWHQAEVACPGFLREGDIFKFQKRLAFVSEEMNPSTGQKYPKISGWRDDERKCDLCGQMPENHPVDHLYKPSVNEVANLYQRLKGLVIVKFKKDCLDLPEKVYRKIVCPPPAQVRNMSKMIAATSIRTIEKLIRLRELSDGFQYVEKEVGSETCQVCHGNGSIPDPRDAEQMVQCTCDAGIRKIYDQSIARVDTPKDPAFKDLLDQYEDVGRFVVYAAFTATIDKLVSLATDAGWYVVRVDGRGWLMTDNAGNVLTADPLKAFQEGLKEFPKLCFIGHPKSAGMGLTLTASPACLFYSNDFDADARIQAEDRIHRPGMDKNLGATIIDLMHLPTDQLILDNIKKKRELQALTLGEIQASLETEVVESDSTESVGR